MAIEVVPFRSRLLTTGNGFREDNDCIVLKLNKTFDGSSGALEVSFPFHEDTPNFHLGLREAMDLRNAIDRLYEIKLIGNKEEINNG